MGWSLLAFDTNHVKRYVFGTDTLKEIRGASSLLDYLNRIKMTQLAEEYQYHAQTVYAHGGSGLFLVPTEQVEHFGKRVQQAYQEETGGGASLTFVWQPLPDNIKEIDGEKIVDILELLPWQFQEEKLHPLGSLALVTHPFLRLCDACGIEYADADSERQHIPRDSDEIDPDEKDARYCTSCQRKRIRDSAVKTLVKTLVKKVGAETEISPDEYLWHRIIPQLCLMKYDIPPQTERPSDFNVFRDFKGAKEYLGLIYADANNMGRHLERADSLLLRKKMAHKVDDALYTAVCTAIVQHLKIADHMKSKSEWGREHDQPVFPFDILLLGGDDICMVVPASVAMDVALTIAETFRKETQAEHTLSVSVVLAPVKYPFGLLQDMAETSLKFAKKVGADARSSQQNGVPVDDTRINFLLVTGSINSDFKAVYESTYHVENIEDKVNGQDFYATLRPYAPDELRLLLKVIRDRDGANLGRTKLYQMREAIFHMNLTTSVSESLAVLRNWRTKQRDHVVRSVYEFALQQRMPHIDLADPAAGFPPVIFPWFSQGKNKQNGHQIYRTPLLDFIELYDILSREGEDIRDKD
jgi:hypothetical protein